jgi:UDP-3-O-[3-hydroxymyristoyl] N-acetylglucosamine deacetylase
MHTTLEGRTIDGAPARVRMTRTDGPVSLGGTPISKLRLAGTFRTTTVRLDGDRTLGTVEHLFAALAGSLVFSGVSIEVDGPALPILDGGAVDFVEALRALDLAPSRPALRVVKDGSVSAGGARADFFVADAMHLEVVLEGVVEGSASWDGDPADFARRIASARTFLLEHDVGAMLSAGFRANVDPKTVVIVTEEGVVAAEGTASRNEPARHKLLDLLGDSYLHGGPFLGRARFVRPGHASNHALVREAIARGILA